MMAVPSTAAALVRSTRSPGRMRRFSMRSRLRTLPAIIPHTTGRVTAAVISVCPPHSVMPHLRQDSFNSSMMLKIKDGVLPTGNRRVVNSQRGIAPAVAMSLALTSTA